MYRKCKNRSEHMKIDHFCLITNVTYTNLTPRNHIFRPGTKFINQRFCIKLNHAQLSMEIVLEKISSENTYF